MLIPFESEVTNMIWAAEVSQPMTQSLSNFISTNAQ
jgi:hypothetical protein